MQRTAQGTVACPERFFSRRLLTRRQPLAHKPLHHSRNQLVELDRNAVEPWHYYFALAFEITVESGIRDLFRCRSLARSCIELLRLRSAHHVVREVCLDI